MDKIDFAIIGGGVVGAAIAQRLGKENYSVIVLESLDKFGEGITSRNSGVIHSGLYYPPGSLKARTCIEGNLLLYDWCKKHKVPFRKTGKLVVALDKSQEDELQELYENAKSSEAKGLSLLTQKKLHGYEPTIPGISALFCSETGIIDPIELTNSLLLDAQSKGAILATNSKVFGIQKTDHFYKLETNRGLICAERVINSAGLYSDEIAMLVGIMKYKIYPNKGDYFRLQSKVKYNHLIYPVKRKKTVGLGVHLTIDLNGGYRLGPDAEYVAEKDCFLSSEHKQKIFYESAKHLLGDVSFEQLSYDTSGIRPKIRSPEENEEKDFIISEDLPGFINLIGIESPGLTSSLAIADLIAKKYV